MTEDTLAALAFETPGIRREIYVATPERVRRNGRMTTVYRVHHQGRFVREVAAKGNLVDVVRKEEPQSLTLTTWDDDQDYYCAAYYPD